MERGAPHEGAHPNGRILQVSGLAFAWGATRAANHRVVTVTVGGAPLDPAKTYSVTVNNFLSTGGDGFTGFTKGTIVSGGPSDLDVLVKYVGALAKPFAAPACGRITRVP
jgi:5'-nucleotidase